MHRPNFQRKQTAFVYVDCIQKRRYEGGSQMIEIVYCLHVQCIPFFHSGAHVKYFVNIVTSAISTLVYWSNVSDRLDRCAYGL